MGSFDREIDSFSRAAGEPHIIQTEHFQTQGCQWAAGDPDPSA
jgi:hypothetical protein